MLSAMETAGTEDMPDDVERKGLGTPATRAGIIEKLVRTGYLERKTAKKATNLLPSEKGFSLIAVVPEVIKSPMLTAEWESKLKEVEHGTHAPEIFMDGIVDMVSALVADYVPPEDAAQHFTSQREAVGTCPRCSGSVVEGKKGFTCEDRECGFAIWKDNRFFAAKKKTVTKQMVAALLKDGRVPLKGCYSAKNGKKYDAVAVLDDTGGRYVNFALEFPDKRGGGHG